MSCGGATAGDAAGPWHWWGVTGAAGATIAADAGSGSAANLERKGGAAFFGPLVTTAVVTAVSGVIVVTMDDDDDDNRAASP